MIIGLDMGGTHVDAVIIEDGRIVNASKKPIDRKNSFQSIWNVLEDLLAQSDKSKIKQINLSTTISTNAIVEKKTDPVAMFIQSGPGLPHDFLACGDENIFLTGYIDHRGRVVRDLNKDEITARIPELREKNIQVCGVVTKFSTRNPNHEIRIKNLLEKHFSHVSMGHTMSGKLNFPRRVNTTYLNAAVHGHFLRFSKSIKQALEKEGLAGVPVYVLKADGGTMSIDGAEKKPVETILSGPAASLMGMQALLHTDEDALLLDVGGTTTDIFFLADGVPLFEPLGIQIGSYKTLVRAIFSQSIGLGGDSFVRVEKGRLKIGPQRLGPPLAFGGETPTPTDAMVVLGYLPEGDKTKAYEGMAGLARELGTDADTAARMILNEMARIIKESVTGLLRDINTRPVYTVKELLEDRKIEPRVIHMIGGPAKVLAPFLEKEFALPCRFPENYHVANAVGAALSRTTAEITLIADTAQKTLSVPELGIYEKITSHFSLAAAKEKALELLKNSARELGADEKNLDAEITEESCFNIVRGFFTSGQNIRIKAQIKPGLTQHRDTGTGSLSQRGGTEGNIGTREVGHGDRFLVPKMKGIDADAESEE